MPSSVEMFIRTYLMSLDSIWKVLNHVLVVGFLNFGFGTILACFLLCLHAACVLLILNNSTISSFSFLAPTEFMIGNALGMTIGSTILSYYIHTVFAHLTCNTFKQETFCSDSALNGLWFWSGTVCFFNFVTALLIAYGRHELAPSTAMYEQVSNMGQYEQQISNQAGGGAGPRPTFVGDYASVPEIRGGTISP